MIHESVVLDADELSRADAVVITTADSGYDWAWIVANSRLVVDTRNATRTVGGDPENRVKL